MLGIIGMLVAVGATVLTAMRFLSPLDRIETGVAEVINGNRDYSFDTPSKDFEGLANALNVMLARLLGRPDPSDDELGGSDDGNGPRWGGELSVSRRRRGRRRRRSCRRSSTSPRTRYFKRTFDEYMAARKQTNEGVEGMTLDGVRAEAARARGGAEEEARRAHGALQGARQGRADDAQAVPDSVATERARRRRMMSHGVGVARGVGAASCRFSYARASSAGSRCGAGGGRGRRGRCSSPSRRGYRRSIRWSAIWSMWRMFDPRAVELRRLGGDVRAGADGGRAHRRRLVHRRAGARFAALAGAPLR